MTQRLPVFPTRGFGYRLPAVGDLTSFLGIAY